MTDLLVYIVFFVALFFIIYRDKEDRFLALFLSTIFFPASVGFIESPQLTPRHVFLYTFFAIECLKNYNSFKVSIFKLPFLLPLSFVLISFILTILTTEGFASKAFYQLVRSFLDLYGYLIAGYLIGLRINLELSLQKAYWFLIAFGLLGIIEGVLHLNYIYPMICSAFPEYDGFFGLGQSVSFRDSWRIRTMITTDYPTALGTLLCVITLLYVPFLKKKNFSLLKIGFFVFVYFLNLYFCGCRTALVCTGAALLFFFVKKCHIAIKFFLAFICSVACILYAAFVIKSFSVEGQGSSLQLRERQLLFSIAQIADKPLFGNGMGYMKKYIFETNQYGEVELDQDVMGLESIIFSKLINNGFFGFGMYMLFNAWMFIWFYRKQKVNTAAYSGYLIVFASTSFFLLSGNMTNASAYVYIVLGMLSGVLVTEQETQTEENPTDKFPEKLGEENVE